VTPTTLEPGAAVGQPAPQPLQTHPIAAPEAAPLAVLPESRPGQTGNVAGEDTPPRQPLALLERLLAQLLGLLSASPLRSLDDLLAAGRILMLALLAGLALRLTGATLGAINDLPLLGGLLELVGLVSLLQFLARHALRQQKRAELLERIRQLRSRLLG
jgi:hypothetical protein